jgi:hypothetical protein
MNNRSNKLDKIILFEIMKLVRKIKLHTKI